MPKFTFTCEKCGLSVQKYTPKLVMTLECKCSPSSVMRREFPKIVGPAEIREMADSYTGVYLPPDNKEVLQDRKLDFFWKEMVPRLVAEHPPEHCVSEGWAYYDEKGQFRVYDKPPHRR